MDTKTFVLGIVPPALAVVAEVFNPVSETPLRRQSGALAPQLVRPASEHEARGLTADLAKRETEKDASAVASAMAAMAGGAVAVSALIPTWIGATAGITAVLIDRVDPIWCLGGVVVWTAVCALVGIK